MMPDKDLRAKVLQKLDFEPTVDGSDIGGVAMLPGGVADCAQELAAEEAARRGRGRSAGKPTLRGSGDPRQFGHAKSATGLTWQGRVRAAGQSRASAYRWGDPVFGIAILVLLATAQPARADEGACVPERHAPAACEAAAPAVGAIVEGTVLQVLDSRKICLALGPTPDRWIALDLADGGTGISRGALMSMAFGETVRCSMTATPSDEEVRAVCLRDGVSIAALARSAAAQAQAADWR